MRILNYVRSQKTIAEGIPVVEMHDSNTAADKVVELQARRSKLESIAELLRQDNRSESECTRSFLCKGATVGG